MEKVAEIKKINAQMMAIRSDISKYEDTLKEYQLYKHFLEVLTPKDWLDVQKEKRKKRREEKRKLQMDEIRNRGKSCLIAKVKSIANSWLLSLGKRGG